MLFILSGHQANKWPNELWYWQCTVCGYYSRKGSYYSNVASAWQGVLYKGFHCILHIHVDVYDIHTYIKKFFLGLKTFVRVSRCRFRETLTCTIWIGLETHHAAALHLDVSLNLLCHQTRRRQTNHRLEWELCLCFCVLNGYCVSDCAEVCYGKRMRK